MSAPFVWFDLTAEDGGTVREFYVGLFGWQIGPGAGDYQGWISDGDHPWAGIASGAISAIRAGGAVGRGCSTCATVPGPM